MASVRGLWRGLAVAGMVIAATLAPATAQQPPASARAMSAFDLYQLYRDTTWPWQSGAAHFFDEGRRFIAWSVDEDGLSHAEGRYELTDTGSMCLVGRWTGLYYPTGLRYARNVRSCFRHVTDGATVWQRRAIGGSWAPFAGPEIAPQLVPSDGATVAEAIEGVEATLAMLGRARPVRAGDLITLYGDRTWDWGNGGVFFEAEGRRFVAYVEDGETTAIGEGRFTLTDRGRLCLVGDWSGVDLVAGRRFREQSSTCFLHLQNAQTLFRAPAGSADWVPVRDRAADTPGADLIAGDRVSARVERLRGTFAAWDVVTD